MKGKTTESQAPTCRRPLDPDRKAIRDLMRNHYSSSPLAGNVRCPCGKRLADCASTVVVA